MSVYLHKLIKALLLVLQEVVVSGLSGFLLQFQVHTFIADILLRIARFNPIDAYAKAKLLQR